MGRCVRCGQPMPGDVFGAVCSNCKRKEESERISASQIEAQKNKQAAERERAEERAMDWRTYTDRFGNKVRVSGKTGDFQVKMFFWGWMGSSYKGNIEIRYPNGDLYVGGVHGSLYHGKGKIIWNDGSSYEGDWVYNHKNGKGKYTWANGAYYEGDFVDGNFNGYGIRLYSDGCRYEGQFKDDKRHGKGKMTWPNGDTYEGDWREDFRTGKGKYVWPNGCYYEGDFVDGNFNGYGVRVYIDGGRYEGQFKDDKRHGKGVLTAPDGTAVEYYYENDKIVRNIAESSAPTPPKATAKPIAEKKTTATIEVRKTETAVPVAKVVEESLEESSEQKIWNSLLKMSEKEKEAFLSSHPEITVPAGVEKIPQYMFNNCLNLKSIRFNQDLREIGPWAFMGCKNLGPVLVIPSSVEKVGRSAFSTCNSVKKIILPNNIHIEGWGFMCGVTEVEFETEPPKGVVLDRGAFCLCNMGMSKETKKKIKELNPKAFKS